MKDQVLWTGPPERGGKIVQRGKMALLITPTGLEIVLIRGGSLVFVREAEEEDGAEARTEHLSVRLTPGEMSAVKEKAEQFGLSVSAYARAVLNAQGCPDP